MLALPYTGTAQHLRIDSLLNELKGTQSSEKSYKIVLELADWATEIAEKGEEYPLYENTLYEKQLNKSLKWVRKNRSPENWNELRTAKLEFLFFSAKRMELVAYANELINDKSYLDKGVPYVFLSETYLDMGYLSEYIQLVPEKYKLLRNNKTYVGCESCDLGAAYYRMKQYKEAQNYYRQATIEMKDESPLKQSSMYNNLGLCFERDGQSDSAKIYFNKALDVLRGERIDHNIEGYDRHFMNVIESNLAQLNMSSGDYDKIIPVIKREIKSGKETNELHIYLGGFNRLGELYYLKKDYKTAIAYLDSARSDLYEHGFIDKYKFNLDYTGKTLLAMGRVNEANEFFDLKVRIADSLDKIRMNNRMEASAVLYKTREKEKEIQRQQNELLRNQDKLSAQRQRQWFFIAFIGVLILAMFALYLLFRKIRKQKIEVDKSLTQRELLLKEIHHRVKNNLQIVASMMKSQGNRSKDEQFRSLMDEGQNRIKSMAMIHERLYRTEDFRNIDLSEYANDLSNSIALSMKNSTESIDVDVNIPEVHFHIDIAVPLGLILNELVTNCYKYAFVNDEPGRVGINFRTLDNDEYELSVEDNGRGLPDDFDLDKVNSLGLVMVKGLAWQLNGGLTYASGQEGTKFQVTFKNYIKELL